MDDYLFSHHVDMCRSVQESTSFLEIFNYSDPTHNSCEEHPLTDDEFGNFLGRQGVFSPPVLENGVGLINGIRLLLQRNAKDSETFAPHVISLTKDGYQSMVRKMHLPFRAIEATSVVGPVFWCAFDHDVDHSHLRESISRSAASCCATHPG